jgi:hypothetical protein
MLFKEEPTTVDQEWNHKDSKVWDKQREAINKEFDEMSKKEIYQVIKIFLRIEGLSNASVWS